MLNIVDFYVLGIPIDTKIGKCKFITVANYPQFLSHLDVLSFTKDKILYLRSLHDENKETLEYLKTLELLDLVLLHSDIREYYEELFAYLFDDEEAFYRLESRDDFSEIRSIILRMNCVKEEIVNPNPEIQAWIEKSRRVKSQDNGKTTIGDMISSVAVHCGYTYKYISEMTIYQLHMTFSRIANFKNYDTTTLFATVSSDKIDIKSWSEHIDMFTDEKHGISREEFDKKTGSLFGSSS